MVSNYNLYVLCESVCQNLSRLAVLVVHSSSLQRYIFVCIFVWLVLPSPDYFNWLSLLMITVFMFLAKSLITCREWEAMLEVVAMMGAISMLVSIIWGQGVEHISPCDSTNWSSQAGAFMVFDVFVKLCSHYFLFFLFLLMNH